MKLESYLVVESDKTVYKNIKKFFVNKYSNYHKTLSFNTKDGLVAYTDSMIQKYAKMQSQFTSNAQLGSPLQKDLSSIASIAYSKTDAAIMANVLIDFIANSEAAMVNGGVKFGVYLAIYLSNYSSISMKYDTELSAIVGEFINSDYENESYPSYIVVRDAAKKVANLYKSDLLYAILGEIFSYTRKLITFYAQTFSSDSRLNSLEYKKGINIVQSQITALLKVFIADFFDCSQKIVNDIGSTYSNYFLENINNFVFDRIKNNLPSIFTNNLYYLTDKPEKINNQLIENIDSAAETIIADVVDFSSIVFSQDEEYFFDDKQRLVDRLREYFNGG